MANVELVQMTEDPLKIMTKAADQSFNTDHEDYEATIKEVMDLGIEVVLEHAKATFRITEMSRACSHQMVRHRLTSIVQKSQRYVDESNFQYIRPPTISENSDAYWDFIVAMHECIKAYSKLRNKGIPKEDARFVLPNACSTSMVITANFREWRHIIQLRGSEEAQWEIREIAHKILDILKENVNIVFDDL